MQITFILWSYKHLHSVSQLMLSQRKSVVSSVIKWMKLKNKSRLRSLPRLKELVERIKLKRTQTFCLIKASENREVLCSFLLPFITLRTNLITGATSVPKNDTEGSCLTGSMWAQPNPSLIDRTFMPTLLTRCLLQPRYFFRCLTESQSWTPQINQQLPEKRVQFCSFFSLFSFLSRWVTKGQCLTEHIFLQINTACKIKADNHSTRETRSQSMTVYINTRASVMICDVMDNSCFGTERQALRSTRQSHQNEVSLLIAISWKYIQCVTLFCTVLCRYACLDRETGNKAH